MPKSVIRVGDRTSHGGVVVTGDQTVAVFGQPAARKGDWFKDRDEDEQIDLNYASGVKRQDAGLCSFYVNAAPNWIGKKGLRLDVLRFALPFVDIIEQPKAFQRLFVDFARRLEALHGHGGFGFVLSPSEWNANQPTEAFVSEQMRGVDVGAPVFSASKLKRDTFKTVSWLTANNHKMVEQAGGLHTLRSELPPRLVRLLRLRRRHRDTGRQ